MATRDDDDGDNYDDVGVIGVFFSLNSRHVM